MQDRAALPALGRYGFWLDTLAENAAHRPSAEAQKAADLFAPVASRLTTYDVKLSPAADAYRKRVMAHPHVADWVNAAASETRLQPTYEY